MTALYFVDVVYNNLFYYVNYYSIMHLYYNDFVIWIDNLPLNGAVDVLTL